MLPNFALRCFAFCVLNAPLVPTMSRTRTRCGIFSINVNRDLEAVKFLMLLLPTPLKLTFMLPSSLPLPHLWNIFLPLPAPDTISRFRVRFHFQSLSSKCFRFFKNLTATSFASTTLLSIKQLIVFSVKKKKYGKFLLYSSLACNNKITKI